MILYLIQMPFELRRSDRVDHISTEFTIDRLQPEIRQWQYMNPSNRIHVEVSASELLAANNPNAFDGDRGKLTHDMVIFSLVGFLATEEFDWQISKLSFRGSSVGTATISQSVSKDNECAVFTKKDMSVLLTDAGNLFADSDIPFFSGRLCLPPKSSLQIDERSLTIRNRYCQVAFNIEPSGGVFFSKPGSGGDSPQHPKGGGQYETRITNLRVETTFFALRAQHRDSEKYHQWCTRLTVNAGAWFG